jgi:hypothetical protein
MTITVLRTKESIHFPGQGVVNHFAKANGDNIQVTKQGHFAVESKGQKLLIPMTNIEVCHYEGDVNESLPVKK